jgi:hypothetical protein
MPARISSPSQPPASSRALVEAIALETQTSLEEVERIYAEELSELAGEAKITQYLSVIVSRRVKERLRGH